MKIKFNYKNVNYSYEVKSLDYEDMKSELMLEQLPEKILKIIQSSTSILDLANKLKKIGVNPTISIKLR